MKFDQAQQDLLQPLLDANVKLYFPFFANTFPIGFHYFQLLEKVSIASIKQHLDFHFWASGIPERKSGETTAFYTTENSLSKEIKELKSGGKNGTFIYKIPITLYQPKWIFTQYSSFIQRYGENQGDKWSFCDRFVSAIDGEYEKFELFTDIPQQAEFIKTRFKNWGVNQEKVEIIGSLDSILNVAHKVSLKVLRLYFCGAPATSMMLRNRARFIGLKLPENLFDGFPDMKTYFVIISDKELDNSDEVIDNVRNYHRDLFESAKKKHHALINILWAFNQFTQVNQLNYEFPDSESYANCLTQHHSPLDENHEVIEL